MVALHRGHSYGALEDVKEEVSSQAVSMLQDGVASSVKVQGSDGTCRVILRIVEAGCRPVAIAQVVEH